MANKVGMPPVDKNEQKKGPEAVPGIEAPSADVETGKINHLVGDAETLAANTPLDTEEEIVELTDVIEDASEEVGETNQEVISESPFYKQLTGVQEHLLNATESDKYTKDELVEDVDFLKIKIDKVKSGNDYVGKEEDLNLASQVLSQFEAELNALNKTEATAPTAPTAPEVVTPVAEVGEVTPEVVSTVESPESKTEKKAEKVKPLDDFIALDTDVNGVPHREILRKVYEDNKSFGQEVLIKVLSKQVEDLRQASGFNRFDGRKNQNKQYTNFDQEQAKAILKVLSENDKEEVSANKAETAPITAEAGPKMTEEEFKEMLDEGSVATPETFENSKENLITVINGLKSRITERQDSANDEHKQHLLLAGIVLARLNEMLAKMEKGKTEVGPEKLNEVMANFGAQLNGLGSGLEQVVKDFAKAKSEQGFFKRLIGKDSAAIQQAKEDYGAQLDEYKKAVAETIKTLVKDTDFENQDEASKQKIKAAITEKVVVQCGEFLLDARLGMKDGKVNAIMDIAKNEWDKYQKEGGVVKELTEKTCSRMQKVGAWLKEHPKTKYALIGIVGGAAVGLTAGMAAGALAGTFKIGKAYATTAGIGAAQGAVESWAGNKMNKENKNIESILAGLDVGQLDQILEQTETYTNALEDRAKMKTKTTVARVGSMIALGGMAAYVGYKSAHSINDTAKFFAGANTPHGAEIAANTHINTPNSDKLYHNPDPAHAVPGVKAIDAEANLQQAIDANDPSHKIPGVNHPEAQPAAGADVTKSPGASAESGKTPEQVRDISEKSIIGKGQGVERVLKNQLIESPKDFGYKGDLNDAKAIKNWAGIKAHQIALDPDNGIIDKNGEVRVGTKGIGRAAYVLEKDASAKSGFRVDKYFAEDADVKAGKGEFTLRDHGGVDKEYEYGHKGGQTDHVGKSGAGTTEGSGKGHAATIPEKQVGVTPGNGAVEQAAINKSENMGALAKDLGEHYKNLLGEKGFSINVHSVDNIPGKEMEVTITLPDGSIENFDFASSGGITAANERFAYIAQFDHDYGAFKVAHPDLINGHSLVELKKAGIDLLDGSGPSNEARARFWEAHQNMPPEQIDQFARLNIQSFNAGTVPTDPKYFSTFEKLMQNKPHANIFNNLDPFQQRGYWRLMVGDTPMKGVNGLLGSGAFKEGITTVEALKGGGIQIEHPFGSKEWYAVIDANGKITVEKYYMARQVLLSDDNYLAKSESMNKSNIRAISTLIKGGPGTA